jgi:ATP-dependent RNA helicase RhlE
LSFKNKTVKNKTINKLKFEAFDLHPNLLEGLGAIGFEEATPVQELAIPIALAKQDLIACAQTGTGKTAAFLLPIIHQLMSSERDENTVGAVVIVPTRELAIQIDQVMEGLGYFTSISAMAMYGGSSGNTFVQEKQAFQNGVDIIIATPGKLISHLNMPYAKLDKVRYLVLDEADKMLDMGFFEDIMRIVKYFPTERQTLMFSATMPEKIRKLAKEILNNPKEISLSIAKPAEGVSQVAFWVYDRQKAGLLKHILTVHQELKTVIVFTNRKENAKDLEDELKTWNIAIRAIHSDLEQSERENIIRLFKNKQLRVLIGTDIIARGLDVEDVDLVVNYEVPITIDDYVHRVGRTARGEDGQGFAFTFVNEKQQQKFYAIERFLEREITRFDVPSFLGETPPIQKPGTYTEKKSFFGGKSKSKDGKSFRNSGRKNVTPKSGNKKSR